MLAVIARNSMLTRYGVHMVIFSSAADINQPKSSSVARIQTSVANFQMVAEQRNSTKRSEHDGETNDITIVSLTF
jgi:hypothetical protein